MKKQVLLLFLVFILIGFPYFTGNVRGIVDGDWYVCNFDDHAINKKWINETVDGTKWLMIEPKTDYPLGVKQDYFGVAGDKAYYFEMGGVQSRNCTFNVYKNPSVFYYIVGNNQGAGNEKHFFNQIFRNSGGQQLFRILQYDNIGAAGVARYLAVYDNNDALVKNYVGTSSFLNHYNITMNYTDQELKISVRDTITYLATGWFSISNFDYVSSIDFSLYDIETSVNLSIDMFNISLGGSVTPDKLWDTGSDFSGCANCDYDGFDSYSFSTTDTVVLESDYKVFVPGREVEQIVLGISSNSDITHMESWLRIGNYYNENRTRYYTYGADHYIIVWEDVNTSFFDSNLPLEFKFITSVTNADLYPYYMHSDVDGDGDIQYKYDLDADLFDGTYNGSNTVGRDLCVEVYYGYGTIAGDVNISVYNESNTSQAINNWSVRIVNKITNVIEYQAVDQSNPLVVDTTEFGVGERLFIIEHEDYYSRTYYADVVSGVNYTLDAYLVHHTIGQWYCFRVLSGEKDLGTGVPVYDARIDIGRYLDNNSGYINVSTLFTDYGGYAYEYLIPGDRYYFNVSKEGYTTSMSNFIMAASKEDCYELWLNYEVPSSSFYDKWYENISLAAEMYGAYMQLGNISVNYTDYNSSTVDTDVYIYEIFNNVVTYKNTSSNTSNSLSLVFGDINTTRTHLVYFYYNNTASFIDQISPVVIVVEPVYVYRDSRTPFSFDTRVTNIIGPLIINGVNVGWHVGISIIIGIALLALLGPFHTGIAVIASGLGIGLTNGIFSLWFTDTFPVLLITLCPLFIIIGIVHIKMSGGVQL